MRNIRMAVPALFPLMLFAGVALALIAVNDSSHSRSRTVPSEGNYTPPSRNTEMWYNGVAIPTLDDLTTWEHATGERPGIVQVYVPLGIKFPLGELQTIERNGAMPVIQIDYKKSFSDILAGSYDKVMRQWGADIKKMNQPVALSFDHEMNGNWYPWGCTHVKPGLFISVWRRMHQLMGSSKAMWVYTINSSNAGFACSPMEYYPGDSYVNWIGIDGYIRNSKENFSSVFIPTINQIRSHSAKPILLTEVGVQDTVNQPSQIQSLYDDAHQSGSVIGIVYFDQSTARGDFRPQDNSAALKNFREEVRKYGNVHTMR
jgi:mannan endo-1,4-beta-mannosidase